MYPKNIFHAQVCNFKQFYSSYLKKSLNLFCIYWKCSVLVFKHGSQFVQIVVQSCYDWVKSLALSNVSNNYPSFGCVVMGISRENLPVVKDTLWESLTSCLTSQLLCESWIFQVLKGHCFITFKFKNIKKEYINLKVQVHVL